MKNRRELMIVLAAIYILFCVWPGSALASEPIRVMHNYEFIDFDVQPAIVSGRTLVPLRAIFESLELQVNWDQENKTIIATDADTEIYLKVGSVVCMVNGIPRWIDVPPQIIDGRVLVPTRFIAESSGSKVAWDSTVRTVIITTGSDTVIGR